MILSSDYDFRDIKHGYAYPPLSASCMQNILWMSLAYVEYPLILSVFILGLRVSKKIGEQQHLNFCDTIYA